MDEKIKHLEFIQAVINRMANNSFLLKGWSVTLTGGLLALTFKQLDRRYLLVSLVVLVFFWLLDSYYLYQERKFIALYNHVRKINIGGIDFSMDTKCYGRRTGRLRCGVSLTLLLFYGGLFTVLLIIRHYI